MDWRCGSSSRLPALWVWGPEFKSQAHKKTNKKNSKKDWWSGSSDSNFKDMSFQYMSTAKLRLFQIIVSTYFIWWQELDHSYKTHRELNQHRTKLPFQDAPMLPSMTSQSTPEPVLRLRERVSTWKRSFCTSKPWAHRGTKVEIVDGSKVWSEHAEDNSAMKALPYHGQYIPMCLLRYLQRLA
jgi:hypothetical protein